MVKYSKRKYNKSKRRYNKSKRRYNKSKRRYNKSKLRYNKSKRRQRGGAENKTSSSDNFVVDMKQHRNRVAQLAEMAREAERLSTTSLPDETTSSSDNFVVDMEWHRNRVAQLSRMAQEEERLRTTSPPEETTTMGQSKFDPTTQAEGRSDDLKKDYVLPPSVLHSQPKLIPRASSSPSQILPLSDVSNETVTL